MSGAQWSAEHLRIVADALEGLCSTPEDEKAAIAALRAFAKVVSVLDKDIEVIQIGDGKGYHATDYAEAPRVRVEEGATPLAAILALADALGAGDGA